MRNKEYDSFGPWIYEISEEYPLPEQFKQYIRTNEEALFSIKIPRKIERKKAHPGMPLYDYVVNLYKDDIHILKREDDGIIGASYLYKSIECIQNRENLLNGNLRIIMSDIVYDLPYNTVSVNIILSMVEIIRQKYTDIASFPMSENSIVDISKRNLSFYFNGVVNDKRNRNPEFKILVYQEESSVGFWETGFIRKLQHRVFGKKLLESLHLSDGRELIILSRGLPFRRRGQAVYGKETFYVPIRKIRNILWEDDQRNLTISNMTLLTSNNRHHIVFKRENSSIRSYVGFLKEARNYYAISTDKPGK